MIPHPVADSRTAAPTMPVSQSLADRKNVRLMVLGIAALIFIVYGLGIILYRAPWYDEGFIANPPYALATQGTPGVSILDDSGPFIPFAKRISMKGIREHIYMEMPMHTVLLAAWFKIVGFNLTTSRLFTLLCGLVALFSWYCVVMRLTLDRIVALTTFVLIAVDYGYVLRSTEIRMDALSAAFGFSGMAVYLYYRERNFIKGIVLSHICVSAGAFSHPNGGMLAFAALCFLTLFYDWRKIRFKHVFIAFLPYLFGFICWGIYISRDVEAFKSQFYVNATQSGRLDTFTSPLNTLKHDILERYLGVLNQSDDSTTNVLATGSDPHGFRKLKLIIQFSYWAGLAGVLLIGSLRRQKGYQALVGICAIYFFVLVFTDGRHSMCYMVHVIPTYVALLAATMVWLWRQGMVQRVAVAGWALVICALHAGGVYYQVHKDTYHQSYLPAVQYIQANVKPDQSIMGPGVLGFNLRYPPNLMDDFRLGFLNHQTPDWIAVNDWYSLWFIALRDVEPDAYQFVKKRLDTEYTPVYNHEGYTIYRKRS